MYYKQSVVQQYRYEIRFSWAGRIFLVYNVRLSWIEFQTNHVTVTIYNYFWYKFAEQEKSQAQLSSKLKQLEDEKLKLK